MGRPAEKRRVESSQSGVHVSTIPPFAADDEKRAETDRRFEAARKRWFAVENNLELMRELAKR